MRDQADKMRGAGKVVLPKDKIDKIYRDISRRDPRILEKNYNDKPGMPHREKPYNVRARPDKYKKFQDKMNQIQKQKQHIYE